MGLPLRKLESEVLDLPAGERAHLARLLLVSLDSAQAADDQGAIEVAWAEEIERRVSAFYAGEEEVIPGDQVFAEIDRLLR